MNSSVSRVVQLRPASAEGYLPMVEALLFAAGKPLTLEHLSTATSTKPEHVKEILLQLETRLEDGDRGVCIAWVGSAAQLVAKPQYQQAIDAARRTDIDRIQAVVDEYLHVQQLNGRRPTTIDNYRAFLSRFVLTVAKPVEEIQPRDIRFFMMAEEQRGNCRNSLATKTVILRSFFSWCEKEDLIDKDPMRKIDKPKEDKPAPKFLTHDELELVREACKKPFEKALLELLYSSGLRVSEAAALDWSDIDWQERTIAVRDGKGGKSRVAPMSSRAALLLRRLQEARKDTDSWVLRSQYDQRMSSNSIERWVRQLGERAKLSRRLTPHSLRHTLATDLLAAGVPIDVV